MSRPLDCDHKWRDYEGIGVVCKHCGVAAPGDVAAIVRDNTERYQVEPERVRPDGPDRGDSGLIGQGGY